MPCICLIVRWLNKIFGTERIKPFLVHKFFMVASYILLIDILEGVQLVVCEQKTNGLYIAILQKLKDNLKHIYVLKYIYSIHLLQFVHNLFIGLVMQVRCKATICCVSSAAHILF